MIFEGCIFNEYSDNEILMTEVDNLAVSHRILEVSVDSLGNIIDTVSMSHIKYDQERRKRYKRMENYRNNYEPKSTEYYFGNGDVAVSRTYSPDDELMSSYEAVLSDKEIISATQIAKNDQDYDTVNMEFSREYHTNGEVKMLTISANHAVLGFFETVLLNDSLGNPLMEYMTRDKDTMEFTKWIYTDTILKQTIYTNYQVDTNKTIYQFDSIGNSVLEECFRIQDGIFVLWKSIDNQFNKENEIIKSTISTVGKSDRRYIKYIHLK